MSSMKHRRMLISRGIWTYQSHSIRPRIGQCVQSLPMSVTSLLVEVAGLSDQCLRSKVEPASQLVKTSSIPQKTQPSVKESLVRATVAKEEIQHGDTSRTKELCQVVTTPTWALVNTAVPTVWHRVHTMFQLPRSIQHAHPVSTQTPSARRHVKMPMLVISNRTNFTQPSPTVSVVNHRSFNSLCQTAPCTCRSLCMTTSQRTSQVSSRKLPTSSWVATPSPWSAMVYSMARTTGRSRTPGMKSGATVAISSSDAEPTNVALRVMRTLVTLQPATLSEMRSD